MHVYETSLHPLVTPSHPLRIVVTEGLTRDFARTVFDCRASFLLACHGDFYTSLVPLASKKFRCSCYCEREGSGPSMPTPGTLLSPCPCFCHCITEREREGARSCRGCSQTPSSQGGTCSRSCDVLQRGSWVQLMGCFRCCFASMAMIELIRA